jgi:hypothetical protein
MSHELQLQRAMSPVQQHAKGPFPPPFGIDSAQQRICCCVHLIEPFFLVVCLLRCLVRLCMRGCVYLWVWCCKWGKWGKCMRVEDCWSIW